MTEKKYPDQKDGESVMEYHMRTTHEFLKKIR